MGEKQPTIILLTPGFAKDETDDFIPVLKLFVQNLHQQYPGLTIIILAFQYPYFAGEYAFHGTRVISFNGGNRGKVHRGLLWSKVWFTLTRLHRHYQVLGVLSFWFGECAFLGGFFGRYYRIKHKAWFLGQDARAGNKFISLIRPDANNLIVLSDALAGELERNYGIKPRHKIPFGVDPSVFPAPAANRPIAIMGAGSLIPLKRYGLFVDIIRQVVQKFPDLKVVLCGQGPEQDALLKRIAAGQLQDNITFLGEVPHARVLTLMQQSRIFLHPSSYEGFSAVCAEALYAGCQVVSFCQPMQQPIDHWHIVYSEEELVNRLVQLLSAKELSHESVLPFAMTDACRRIMTLFGYEQAHHGR
jgi:glycosyltransferase involved in cell wall biosynthesis